MSSYASVLWWFFIYVCSTVINSWFWISLKYEVRPVASCCFCSSKFGDGSPATPASWVNQPWQEKNQPAEGNNVALVSPPWRQVLRDQQVLTSTKMPSKDPTLWLCCIISLSPRTILMIWRGDDRTHLNTKVTSVVPSVSKNPKSETWFMWRLGFRIQFTSIYPKMLVGLCLSWTILIISEELRHYKKLASILAPSWLSADMQLFWPLSWCQVWLFDASFRAFTV